MARGSRGSTSGGYDRPSRVGDLIKQEVASMLIRGDIKDPRVGLVTLTDIKMTRDLKNARIFFTITGLSLVGDEALSEEAKEEAENAGKGLQSAAGFIRKELGRVLSLKYIPNIIFEYDSTLDYASRINKVIAKINKEEGSN